MTVAGSDSGGGAGIQADLKTFAALGVYGTCAITALTAQNTVRVAGVHAPPADFVAAQMNAVFEDIEVHAVKTGMLYGADIVRAVARTMMDYGEGNLVVDPVMIAKSGDALLRPDAVEALKSELLPLALVITPNIPEAEALSGMKINDVDGMIRAAGKIIEMGAENVVVKGGHMTGDTLCDVLADTDGVRLFERKRIDTKHTHGTGCTFSAAITAGIAKSQSVHEAVAEAEKYIECAIDGAGPLGSGHGPVNHFWRTDKKE